MEEIIWNDSITINQISEAERNKKEIYIKNKMEHLDKFDQTNIILNLANDTTNILKRKASQDLRALEIEETRNKRQKKEHEIEERTYKTTNRPWLDQITIQAIRQNCSSEKQTKHLLNEYLNTQIEYNERIFKTFKKQHYEKRKKEGICVKTIFNG